MNRLSNASALLLHLVFATGAVSAQTGTLDQDNTSVANVTDALGFAPFVYEQVVEVGLTGALEGFVIRIVEFNAPSPTLPVAIYEWNASTASKGSLLWSTNVPPPTLPFFTSTFIDTSAAGLNFGVGDTFLIQVGDAVLDLTGWDLSLNEGFDQTTNTFVALYPELLYTDGIAEPFKRLVFQTWMTDAQLGAPYCSANPNTTGVPGSIRATGTSLISANDLRLVAENLPLTSFGFFLTSRSQGFVLNPSGSQGNLCLSGSIGRYVGPGQIQNSGLGGTFQLTLDLLQIPTPTGFVAAQVGETWNFQAWYRDQGPLGPSSNFTGGVEVDLR